MKDRTRGCCGLCHRIAGQKARPLRFDAAIKALINAANDVSEVIDAETPERAAGQACYTPASRFDERYVAREFEARLPLFREASAKSLSTTSSLPSRYPRSSAVW